MSFHLQFLHSVIWNVRRAFHSPPLIFMFPVSLIVLLCILMQICKFGCYLLLLLFISCSSSLSITPPSHQHISYCFLSSGNVKNVYILILFLNLSYISFSSIFSSEFCPVERKCRASNSIYQATIHPKENKLNNHIYIGISGGEWKQRLYKHRHSFPNPRLKHQTALSKKVWELVHNHHHHYHCRLHYLPEKNLLKAKNRKRI